MNLKKNRKVHGSVLLTVVAVMSLLIIFLFGTLVLASSTNNRAHVNYSSAQTSITSRTIVESTLKAMSSDTNFASVVNSMGSGSSALSIPVNINSSVPAVGSMGHPEDVVIEYAGTKKCFDETDYKWVDRTVLKITSKVRLGGADSVTSAYIVKDPSPKPPTSGGAGFISTGEVNFTTGMNMMGGTYINMPPVDRAEAFEDMQYAYDDDNPGTEAYLYPSGNPISVAGGGGDAKCNVEADYVIWGDFYTKMYQKLIFPTTKKGVTVWGDCVFASNTNFEFENHLRTEDSAGNEIVPAPEFDFAEIPYFYVDQQIRPETTGDTKVYIGTYRGSRVSQPLNIFARSVNINDASEVKLGGDLYLMDAKASSLIASQNAGGVLYNWSASVISKTYGGPRSKGGNIYSKGNLTLKNMHIDGGVYCEGDLTLRNDVVINGDIACKGTLRIEGKTECNGDDIYVSSEPVISGAGLYINGVKFDPAEGMSALKAGYSYQQNRVDTQFDPDNFYQVSNVTYNYGVDVVDHGGWSETVVYDINYDPDHPYDGGRHDELRAQAEADPEAVRAMTYIVSVDHEGNPVKEPAWPGGPMRYTITNEDYSYFRLGSNEKVSSDAACVKHYIRVNSDGSEAVPREELPFTPENEWSYFDASGNLVPRAEAYELKSLSNVSSLPYVYPPYAERNVILGFEGDTSSKIISTFKDLYDNVCNPYQQTVLPAAVRDQLEDISLGTLTVPTYTSTENISAGTGKVATAFNSDGTISYSNSSTLGPGQSAVITGSCILSGTFTSNNGEHMIVVRPEEPIIVILDNFTMTAETQMIVDDTAGGSVYLYVPGNGAIQGSATDVAEGKKASNATIDGAPCVSDLHYGGTPATAEVSYQSSILTSSYRVLLNYAKTKAGTEGNDDSFAFQISTADGVARTGAVPVDEQSPAVHYNASSNEIVPPLLEQMHLKLGLKAPLGRPNIDLRGGKGTKTTLNATAYHSVNIISSEMEVEFGANNGGEFAIYYNGTNMKKVNNSNGPYIFGCVNAHGADAANEFKNLYVRDKSGTDDGSGEGSGSGGRGFKILYFDEY